MAGARALPDNALTRARDELVMTFVGHPSIFGKAMAGHVAIYDGVAEQELTEGLGGA